MFWTTGLFLAFFSQVPAGVVDSKLFSEDVNTKVMAADSRISFGWEAYPGQFPYVAALRFTHSGGDVTRCGGSVVHRSWILTSARCVANRISVVVTAGSTDFNAAPEYISVDNMWRINPGYNPNTATIWNPNDIAILKPREPITFSKLVQPVRIQHSAMAFLNYANEVLVTSGWGMLEENGAYPNVLNWVYLRGVTNALCRQIFTTEINVTHICATAYNATSQSICNGDHGGPLVHIGLNGEPVLVGVASFWSNQRCHVANRPSGFIRPGAFHSWLTEVTGLDFENLSDEDGDTETPEPPTTEVTVPPTTETPEPPTTEATVPPTTEATVPPTTGTPEPDSEENDNDYASSESDEDPDIAQLLKKLHVKVIKISKTKIISNITINYNNPNNV